MKKEKTFSAVMWSKRSKRYVSLTLVFSLLLGLLCMLVPAAVAAETADGLVYEEVNEEITITGYTGAGGEVVIPAEIDGKPVVAIGRQAFRPSANPSANNITNLVIPNSVKNIIGAGLFRGCENLISVTFPEDVVIDSTASMFRDCTALESITIPKNLTEIGNAMFQNCISLIEVLFPDGIAILLIGMFAFQKTAISEFDSPETLTSIDQEAFEGCTNLTDITIYDKVTSIVGTAFNNIPKEQ